MMNITFIGMPGVGKSTIGKSLAQEIKYNYLDIDQQMELNEGKTIQELLLALGDEKFILSEEKEVLRIKNKDNTIISTGGSIIYSKKAMLHLKEISRVIYLKCSINSLMRRIKNRTTRGIVGIKDKSFESIYKERTKLYEQYSDLEIDCESLDVKKIIAEIKEAIKNE